MSKENDIVAGYTKQKADNVDGILKEVCDRSGFTPINIINESKWWNSDQIGAIHYDGIINEKVSVLKLQLVKIDSSEVSLIEKYHKANHSANIRAPYIYYHAPWDEGKNYEAIIMEKVEKVPVVNYPTTKAEIDQFLFFYKEYKMGTDVSNPWVTKPHIDNVSGFIETRFGKWREMRKDVAKNWQAVTSNDEKLIDLGIQKLCEGYEKNLSLEFMHGHFGPQDLSKIDDTHAIVFSNLYWSWRSKYYDLIFGHHYFKFFMANSEKVTKVDFINMSDYWFTCISNVALNQTGFDEKLFNLAYLERLVAGLNLDFVNIDSKLPNVNSLLDNTRLEIERLLKIL